MQDGQVQDDHAKNGQEQNDLVLDCQMQGGQEPDDLKQDGLVQDGYIVMCKAKIARCRMVRWCRLLHA